MTTSQLSGQTTVLLHPAAEGSAETHGLARRLPTLEGMTVGLVDNHKKNADVFLEELARILQDDYGVSQIVTYRKASQSMPTPPEALDDLARRCDATIHAVAD